MSFVCAYVECFVYVVDNVNCVLGLRNRDSRTIWTFQFKIFIFVQLLNVFAIVVHIS